MVAQVVVRVVEEGVEEQALERLLGCVPDANAPCSLGDVAVGALRPVAGRRLIQQGGSAEIAEGAPAGTGCAVETLDEQGRPPADLDDQPVRTGRPAASATSRQAASTRGSSNRSIVVGNLAIHCRPACRIRAFGPRAPDVAALAEEQREVVLCPLARVDRRSRCHQGIQVVDHAGQRDQRLLVRHPGLRPRLGRRPECEIARSVHPAEGEIFRHREDGARECAL